MEYLHFPCRLGIPYLDKMDSQLAIQDSKLINHIYFKGIYLPSSVIFSSSLSISNEHPVTKDKLIQKCPIYYIYVYTKVLALRLLSSLFSILGVPQFA